MPENPLAIGLFDGDDDGLIDVYLANSGEETSWVKISWMTSS
jgi:hypothetical protein